MDKLCSWDAHREAKKKEETANRGSKSNWDSDANKTVKERESIVSEGAKKKKRDRQTNDALEMKERKKERDEMIRK